MVFIDFFKYVKHSGTILEPSWNNLKSTWTNLHQLGVNLCHLDLKKTSYEFTLGHIGQLGPQNGSKMGVPKRSANQLFGCHVGSWGPRKPRWPQEPTKRPQETPRDPQEPPKPRFLEVLGTYVDGFSLFLFIDEEGAASWLQGFCIVAGQCLKQSDVGYSTYNNVIM